jgi:hypothetical protein
MRSARASRAFSSFTPGRRPSTWVGASLAWAHHAVLVELLTARA